MCLLPKQCFGVWIGQDQLRQLRDMGITDEALARRALQVSNGDIQAALEFIFGDDMWLIN